MSSEVSSGVYAAPPAARGEDPFGGTFDFADDLVNIKVASARQRQWERDNEFCKDQQVDLLGELAVRLQIDIDTVPIGDTLNECADEDAVVRSVGCYVIGVHLPDPRSKEEQDACWRHNADGTMTHVGPMLPRELCFRDLTQADCDEIVVNRRTILFKGYHAKDAAGGQFARLYVRTCGFWRLRDVYTAMLDFECRTRPSTSWFGGVDAHHTCLDGLLYSPHIGHIDVMWGS